MSGAQPPTPPPSPPPISGRLASLRPWQLAVIGVAVVGFVALVPALSRLGTRQKAHDATQAVIAASNGTGEAWHAPVFPEPPPPKEAAARVLPTPPPPLIAAPPPPPLVARAPAVSANGGINDLRMFGQRGAPPPPPATQAGSDPVPQHAPASAADGSLGGLLKPTELVGYRATSLARPWATIEQGRIIACNSVTPMTSSLPGFVKAKVTYDVRSADGTTTLIDRNSDIFGEIAHGLANGQDRLFVLWRQITTPPPNLVRITLNAPAADELGEAGLPGDINHHTWQRIGGALLLSGVDAALQGASLGLASALASKNSSNNGFGGSSLNFYQFQGNGQSLASALLQHQIAIPDTLHRDQGLPCSIFVSGDLDFSSVYKLKLRGEP